MTVSLAKVIRDKGSFEAWLATRPDFSRQDELLIIAHRCTLRLLPYLMSKWGSQIPVDRRLLSVLRSAISVRSFLLSTSVTTGLLYELITQLHEQTAATGDLTLRSNEDAKLSQAARTFAYVVEEIIGNRFKGGAISAIELSSALELYAPFFTPHNMWQWVSSDAVEFSFAHDLTWVMNSELWSSNVIPREVAQLTDASWVTALKSETVLVEWYKHVCEGTRIFNIRSAAICNDLETNIALGSTDGTFKREFWTRPPSQINADIKRWVLEASATDARLSGPLNNRKPDAEDPPLSDEDFHSRAATVETTIRNGIVVLEHEEPQTDLRISTVESAAADLAKAIRRIANEAAAAQTDQRFIAFLINAADAIEKAVHNQEQLFESGRNQKALNAYSETVDAEWNALLAAQYHGLVAQFAQTLNRFEAWREFVTNPVVADEQVKPEIVVETAETIIGSLAQHSSVFATSVLQKLQWLVVRFRQTVSTLQVDDAAHPMATTVFEVLQSDLAISISNTLLSYLQSGLYHYGSKFGEGMTGAFDKLANGGGYLAVIAMIGAAVTLLQRQYPELYSTVLRAIKALRKAIKETDPQ